MQKKCQIFEKIKLLCHIIYKTQKKHEKSFYYRNNWTRWIVSRRVFIRKRIPELSILPNRDVHTPWLSEIKVKDYPAPLVDEKIARNEAAKGKDSGPDIEKKSTEEEQN